MLSATDTLTGAPRFVGTSIVGGCNGYGIWSVAMLDDGMGIPAQDCLCDRSCPLSHPVCLGLILCGSHMLDLPSAAFEHTDCISSAGGADRSFSSSPLGLLCCICPPTWTPCACTSTPHHRSEHHHTASSDASSSCSCVCMCVRVCAAGLLCEPSGSQADRGGSSKAESHGPPLAGE